MALESSGDSGRGGPSSGSEGEDAEEGPRHVFFYSSSSPYSNFYPARFRMTVRQPGLSVSRERPGDTQPAGRAFSYFCSEQAMMHAKALLFGDYTSAARVMDATKPQQCKKLGRGVRGYVPHLWDQYKVKIVKAAVSCKFGQNQDIRKALMETTGSLLVEASPKDKVWGIGLSEEEAKRTSSDKWRGLNLLGKTLTEVREGLSSGDIPPAGLELELPQAALIEAMPETVGENRPGFDSAAAAREEASDAAHHLQQASGRSGRAAGGGGGGGSSKAAVSVRSRIMKRLGRKR